MNGLMLVLGLSAAVGFGIVVVALLCRDAQSLPLTIGLGVAAGLGLSSVLFFFWLLTYGAAGRGFVIVEAMIIVIAALCLARRPSSSPPHAAAECPRWLLWGAAATLSVFIAGMCLRLLRAPDGLWDAWSIWNLRARFLFRGGDHWRDGFDPLIGWSHPDYPLLLPGAVARVWSYLGVDDPLAPAGLTLVFAIGLAALVFGAISQLRDRTRACVALLILLSPAVLVRHAAGQYADVPLGLFIAAACVGLLLAERQGHHRWLLLAGLMAGLAAWTKNEGLLFLVCFLGAYATIQSIHGGLARAAGGVGWLILGAAPALAALGLFKATLAPANDLLANFQLDELLTRTIQADRHQLILHALANHAVDFAKASLLLLPLYLATIGIAPSPADRTARYTIGLCLVLQLSGYYLVYLFTHLPLAWHLETSLSRLYAHLWPALVLLLGLTLRSPLAAGAPRGDP